MLAGNGAKHTFDMLHLQYVLIHLCGHKNESIFLDISGNCIPV